MCVGTAIWPSAWCSLLDEKDKVTIFFFFEKDHSEWLYYKRREVCDKAMVEDWALVFEVTCWQYWRWMNGYIFNNILVDSKLAVFKFHRFLAEVKLADSINFFEANKKGYRLTG